MQTEKINVPVKVTGRHISITEAIKHYATTKIEHLHLDYPSIIEAHVILDVKKHRHFAEIILHCNNHITIEASHETDDIYASIDGVVAKIAQQMRKYKTKIPKSHRPGKQSIRRIEEQVIQTNEDAFREIENSEPAVIETELYPVKPMFVDEAVLEIEMSNRQFVVFQNAKSEKVNILYRRKDNGFGLIEPKSFGSWNEAFAESKQSKHEDVQAKINSDGMRLEVRVTDDSTIAASLPPSYFADRALPFAKAILGIQEVVDRLAGVNSEAKLIGIETCQD